MNILITHLLEEIAAIQQFCNQTVENSENLLDHTGQKEFFSEIREELYFLIETIKDDIARNLYRDEGEEIKQYFEERDLWKRNS